MASNGWLEAWRKRYSVKSCVLSGEAADVSDDIISDWSARLPSMCDGYSFNNIFNADETGMFFRSIPNRSMVEKGDACKGGKKSKDRLTFLFCASAVGEKLKPLVIGKSLNPRCFKGIHKDMLGVHLEANKKAWMTSKIFVDWVERTNQKFRFENRNVLMFVDNCSSHPDVEASNLRMVFLPPNTTSKLQPMDAGIIQSVKINYRKRLLRHLISRMDACNTASELVKLVNILDAILWIKDVWSSLPSSTIQKCFTKCGFQRQIEASESDVLASPFEEIMTETEFILDGITFSQFATFDNNLATFATSRDDWETEIVEKAKGVDLNDSERYSDENEDSDEGQKERSDKVISLTEAGVMIGKLKKFSLSNNEESLLEIMIKAEDLVENLKIRNLKQSTLDSWFYKQNKHN